MQEAGQQVRGTIIRMSGERSSHMSLRASEHIELKIQHAQLRLDHLGVWIREQTIFQLGPGILILFAQPGSFGIPSGDRGVTGLE